MKKFLFLITHCAFLIANCPAAELQFRWQTEVSDALPYAANAFQGETFTLEVGLKQYGQDLTGEATATFYWQTKEMAAEEWYSTEAIWDAVTGRASVDFTPAMDTGATAYRFFFGIESTQGKNYRAYGTLRLKPSPGFNPATLAKPDIYAALTADILADVFAQTDAKYQPLGDYLTEESDPVYAAEKHTLATTSQVSNLNSQLSTLQEALETKAPIENPAFTGTPTVGVTYSYVDAYNDQGAGMKGYYGRLSNIGVQGNVSVTPLTMSLFRRNGNTTNGDASLYLRILRVVDGAWQVAYQSTAGIRMNDYAEHARMTWTLQSMNGHGAIPSEEMIAIVLTSSTTATATTTTTFGSKATSVSGGLLTGNVATSTTPSVGTWRPAFCVDYVVGSVLATMDDLAAIDPTTSWDELEDKPSAFPPEEHTHPTSQITDFEDEVLSAVAEGSATLKAWVKSQAPDENGNITHSNLNSRAETVSDMTYINAGGTASRALSAITAEGNTKSQIQQVIEDSGSAHLSSNTMTDGATATVKARHLDNTTGTITAATLSANADDAKLTLADTTGTLTLTPTTQWPWSKLSGIPSTFTPTDHNHDARYLKLSGGTLSGNLTLNGSDNFATRLRFGGTALAPGLMTRGISGSDGNATKGGLHFNYDGNEVPTATYLSDLNRGVFSRGCQAGALVLRKMDGDTLYAAKSDVATLQTTLASVTSTANTNMGDIFTLQTDLATLQGEASTHAPVSAVTMTESNVTYIWQWDDEEGTFALIPSSNEQ